MPAISLTERRQDALRALLAHEPAPGDPLPGRRTLETISRLIPCDVVGVGVADRTGVVEDSVSLPSYAGLPWEAWECAVPLGVVHHAEHPEHRRALARLGMTDGLLLGFDADRDHVVQLCLDRLHRRFTDADVALLRAVAPAVHRLLREHAAARLPIGLLTAQERRVVVLVAAGLSNADVATRMHVAPSTVRKHLEHVFRKLGVSNRLAAVKAFEEHVTTAHHRRGRDEIFA